MILTSDAGEKQSTDALNVIVRQGVDVVVDDFWDRSDLAILGAVARGVARGVEGEHPARCV